MKLYLVPFNAEAKVLTSILPNCKKVSNSFSQNRWEYKGGVVVSWNEVGTEAIKDVIMKIGNFEKYTSVILFGSSTDKFAFSICFMCSSVKVVMLPFDKILLHFFNKKSSAPFV